MSVYSYLWKSISQLYGVSLAVWDHTVLPSTRHKGHINGILWRHPFKVSEYWVLSIRYRVFLAGSWGWWRRDDRAPQVRCSRTRCRNRCGTTRRVRIRSLPRIGPRPSLPLRYRRQNLYNNTNNTRLYWGVLESKFNASANTLILICIK